MIYIVAYDYREAAMVARHRGLPSGAWRYVYLAEQLRGTWQAQVLIACWPTRRYLSGAVDAAELADALRRRDTQIEYVGCPYMEFGKGG